MLRKILAGAGMGVVGISLLAATMAVVGAQNMQGQSSSSNSYPLNHSSKDISSVSSTPLTRMMIEINRNGRGRLVGTIASVSGNTLGVQSWGGVWNVDVSSAKLSGASEGTVSLSQLQIGDWVVVNGTAGTSNWSFTALMLRDASLNPVMPIWGVISSPTSTGFTFTRSNGTVYQVTFAPSVNIWINDKPATAADLMSGMRARIRGAVNNNTMTVVADEVRASVPLANVMGTISNPLTSGFTLTTASGTAYQVVLTGSTKIYVNGRSATLADLVAGMTARVRGIVNSTTQTITASGIMAYTSGGPWSGHVSSTNMNTSSSRY